MNLFRCCGSGSNGTNLIGLLKQSIHPEWKQGRPLPDTVTDVNQLTTFFSLEYPSSISGKNLNVCTLLSFDQRNIVLPDNDFIPACALMWIDGQYATLSLPKEIPTISATGVLNVGERYQAARINTPLNYLKSTTDFELYHQTETKTLTLTNGFYTNDPHSVLFSTVDIVSQNGNYHIYKNIDMNDYKLIYQT